MDIGSSNNVEAAQLVEKGNSVDLIATRRIERMASRWKDGCKLVVCNCAVELISNGVLDHQVYLRVFFAKRDVTKEVKIVACTDISLGSN